MPRKPPTPPKNRAAALAVRRIAGVVRLPSNRYDDGETTKHLTDHQAAALRLLLEGATYVEAADKLGIDPADVRNWISYNALFQQALVAAQARRRKLIQLKLEQGALRAVDALVQLATDEGVNANARVRASATRRSA